MLSRKIKLYLLLYFHKIKFLPYLVSNVETASTAAPVFIIGANRSGTSILSYLISQHPDLEGLFSGYSLENRPFKDGHGIGFCESMHIWGGLNMEGYLGIPEPTMWGLPEYLHHFYRTRFRSKWEARQLRASLLSQRQTTKAPLIKDQLNLLRIGLIKDLFPRARFIMISRDYVGYIRSNAHKWRETFLPTSGNHPRIGLHWFLLNNIARYDLARFAPDDHIIVNFEELVKGGDDAKQLLDSVFRFLDIRPYKVDVSMLDAKSQFSLPQVDRTFNVDFSIPSNLVDFERSWYASASADPGDEVV